MVAHRGRLYFRDMHWKTLWTAAALLAAACGGEAGTPARDAPEPPVSAVSRDHVRSDGGVAASRPAAANALIRNFIARVPDSVFVRHGACPFECCMYRECTARAAIAPRAQPRDSAPAGFTLQPGEVFSADSGNVYVTSAQLVVVTDSVGDAHYWSFSPGDTLVVLDHVGEGHFSVWQDGKVQDTEGFWWPGRQPAVADTIGTWKTEWWVHATRSDGRSGWFIADNSIQFDNADACGG